MVLCVTLTFALPTWREQCAGLVGDLRRVPAERPLVLSSRPHDRLRTLKSVREAALETIEIKPELNKVNADVRSYAAKLFEETQALARRPLIDRETAATSLCQASAGNFAYLAAYARSLRAALQPEGAAMLDELLRFEALPAGLYPLYAALVRRVRRQVESMGQLEVASPRAKGDFVGSWEGVGQRILAVLAVARAPLSLEQVWPWVPFVSGRAPSSHDFGISNASFERRGTRAV